MSEVSLRAVIECRFDHLLPRACVAFAGEGLSRFEPVRVDTSGDRLQGFATWHSFILAFEIAVTLEPQHRDRPFGAGNFEKPH